MASNEQSVTLLRINKRAQVEALNALGFNLADDARASQFPELVKWAAGLLDVTVAANRKSDNRKFFFTVDEWQSLSYTEQNLFLLRGVRVRACGQSFIIAPDNLTNLAWGANLTIPTHHDCAGKKDLYRFYDALAETQLIAEFLDGKSGNGVTGAPAADAALGYKAYSLADGLNDDSQWCLPTMAHLAIMFRYRNEIEAVLSSIWSSASKFLNAEYWSCCQNTYAWVNIQGFDVGGQSYSASPSSKANVRPISLN
ncbi:MAG: Vir protein [Bacteroides sp.]|nr:Vir protein [Bacteroides sp.]